MQQNIKAGAHSRVAIGRDDPQRPDESHDANSTFNVKIIYLTGGG